MSFWFSVLLFRVARIHLHTEGRRSIFDWEYMDPTRMNYCLAGCSKWIPWNILGIVGQLQQFVHTSKFGSRWQGVYPRVETNSAGKASWHYEAFECYCWCWHRHHFFNYKKIILKKSTKIILCLRIIFNHTRIWKIRVFILRRVYFVTSLSTITGLVEPPIFIYPCCCTLWGNHICKVSCLLIEIFS